MAPTGKGVTAEVIEEKMQNPIKDHRHAVAPGTVFIVFNSQFEHRDALCPRCHSQQELHDRQIHTGEQE